MRTYSSLFLLATLGVLTLPGAALALDTSDWKCESCPYPKGSTGTVEVGLGANSGESARFGDYTGLERKGAHLVLGAGLRTRGDSGYYAELNAADLGLDTRSLSLQSGHEGIYALSASYAELPRWFGEGGATPYLGAGTVLQTLPAGYPAAGTADMPLATTLQPVEPGFKRKQIDASAKVVSMANWTWRVAFRRDMREGTRPLNAAFFSSAMQLLAPVEQVTDQLEVQAAYATRSLQAQLAYTISRFRNGPEATTFDNPYWPVTPGATMGQVAMAPDNLMHQISGSAGYQITPTVRASADFAVGRMTQDEPYIPTTLNAVLQPAVSLLPAATLDGRVDTFNANVKLSAAPMDDLRVNATYARDVRDNRTATGAYPLVATDVFLNPALRSNTPFGMTQDRFKLSADYRGIEAVKLSAGAEHDYRSRSYTEAVQTRETTLWARVGLQPLENLAVSGKLSRASRNHSTYGTAVWFGSPENPLLRKYNLAERDRTAFGLRGDLAVSETIALGLGLDYANDDYGNSIVGLNEARSVNLSADLSAALSEQTQLTAYAQTERIRSRQSGSQFYGPIDWTAQNKDRFNVLGLGVKHALIADKFDIGADLSLSRSASETVYATGFVEPALPQARTTLTSFKLNASYKLQDNLWLNGSLWHQRYEQEDWRVDGVLPATLPNLLSLGLQEPEYRVNVARVSLRYRF